MAAHRRADYAHFHPITTRWLDNDAYGHVNNVVYYHWFDTIINELLISGGVLDIVDSSVIGLVIESNCTYFSPVAFPDRITAALRVAALGNSSIRYELAIFCNDDDLAAAQGYVVHVCVERASRQSTPIPLPMRSLLQSIPIPSFAPSQP
ncbi:thioesterase family protein [Actimicrobium sp. CCI2.3]|nr:thioesterase family protein [Actimicrobium sp. CCI2.3]MDY7575647.1 thioesterase family protein [Actimicrobium sp. CCI2.3]MEB0021982.1 thioesterase family protein [Actimicrobium sp. CCI2.3]